MKMSEVEIGKVYVARVSGLLVPVRLDEEINRPHRQGRWFNAINLRSGRTIHISAAKCRKEVSPKKLKEYLALLAEDR